MWVGFVNHPHPVSSLPALEDMTMLGSSNRPMDLKILSFSLADEMTRVPPVPYERNSPEQGSAFSHIPIFAST